MKNRIVRWTIYFVVGVAIGVGVNYFNKQNNIDEGVVELSPDAVQEESIAAPSRVEDAMEDASEAAEGVMETVKEDMEEAGAVLEEAGETVAEKAEKVMDNIKEMMPAEEASEGMVEEAPETMEEATSEAMEKAVKAMDDVTPEAAPELDSALTPMPYE